MTPRKQPQATAEAPSEGPLATAAEQVHPGGSPGLEPGLDEALTAELGPAEEADRGPGAARDPEALAAGTEPPPDEACEAAEGPELSEEELERSVAALLFASPEPLSSARLAALLGAGPRKRLEAGLEALARRLEASGLPFELREIAGGWQLFTTPDMAETVGALSRVRRDEKVSPAALETLAVVAYRQPVTKAEVEAIRGVQVGPILRSLVDRGLVRVTGRSPEPGHPLLYGTTRRFLDVFGLAGLDDLPRDGELLRD